MLQRSSRPGCAKYKVHMAQWQAPEENRTETEKWPGLRPVFFHQLKLFHLLVYAGLGGGRVSPRSSLPLV